MENFKKWFNLFIVVCVFIITGLALVGAFFSLFDAVYSVFK